MWHLFVPLTALKQQKFRGCLLSDNWLLCCSMTRNSMSRSGEDNGDPLARTSLTGKMGDYLRRQSTEGVHGSLDAVRTVPESHIISHPSCAPPSCLSILPDLQPF